MTYLIKTKDAETVFQGNFNDAKNFAEEFAQLHKAEFVTIGEDENHTICCKVRDRDTGIYKPWETIRINTSY